MLKIAREANTRLINENTSLIEAADNKFENGTKYNQMTKKIYGLKLQFKAVDGLQKSYRKSCVEKDKLINFRRNTYIV